MELIEAYMKANVKKVREYQLYFTRKQINQYKMTHRDVNSFIPKAVQNGGQS